MIPDPANKSGLPSLRGAQLRQRLVGRRGSTMQLRPLRRCSEISFSWSEEELDPPSPGRSCQITPKSESQIGGSQNGMNASERTMKHPRLSSDRTMHGPDKKTIGLQRRMSGSHYRAAQGTSGSGSESTVCGPKLALWPVFYEAVRRRAEPGTTHHCMVQRTAYLTFQWLTVVMASLYAVMYAVLGFPTASILTFLYCAVAGVCIKATIKYDLYQYSTVMLKMLVIDPFLVQFALGGIIRSGAVMLWSLLSPVGAALILKPCKARPYFYAYMFNIAVACLFEFFGPIPDRDRLTPVDIFFFGIHYAAFGATTFYAASTFASHFKTEQSYSEKLLLNMFPTSIARRLKSGENPIVDHADCVTILFANLVGFTHAASSMDANFLIGKVLRDVFVTFDNLVDRRNLEKIKTSGDQYLVVGGLRKDGAVEADRERDDHAYQVVLLALEFQDALQQVYDMHGMSFQIRIGVHTGPAIAGVLGVKRFAFDVWGDAVNTASRMESHGMPGQVHISADTYEKVKCFNFFRFSSPRRNSEIKGKGSMKTYWVKRRRFSDGCCWWLNDAGMNGKKNGGAARERGKLLLGHDNLETENLEVEPFLTSEKYDKPNSNMKKSRNLNGFSAIQFLSKVCGQGVKPETLFMLWVFKICCSMVFIPLCTHAGEGSTSFLAWSFVVVSTVSAGVSSWRRSYEVFESLLTTAMYLVTFVGPTFQLGGIRKYGNGMLWMFVFPLSSALFHSPRKAQRWFIVYLCCTIVCHIYDDSYRRGYLTTVEVVQFALANILVLTVMFTLVHLYASEIKKEYAYSECLLLNALPQSIVRRLRQDEGPIIDNFENTTVLIADLVGFTTASSVMDPQFLIGHFLRDLFFEFDKLIGERHLEKIKTIGDAIMVVGGLTEDGFSNHAMQVLLLAKEFHERLRHVNERHGTDFSIRIGVHTGPIIAGVLGVRRFRYDVWGDTVAMACRLEQNCIPGCTHVSATTYDAINDLGLFDFRAGEGLVIRESITMKTYLLTG